MCSWLGKNNWRNSPSHLLLLSNFTYGNSPEEYSDAEHWKSVLRERPLRAIKKFINDGMLHPAGLAELVDHRFKVTELKTMLKERNLKISGPKVNLIKRIVENDQAGMREATKDINLYQCTSEGAKLVEQYLEKEKAKKVASERDVIAFLSRQEFSKAVSVVAQYEASRVFPRGLGIDWNNYDGEPDTKFLKAIFEGMPGILNGMEENRLGELRLAAGMMQLWGTNRARQWLSDGFETGIHLDGDAACRMLLFYVSHLNEIETYKSTGIKIVKLSCVDDENTCAECRRISGKKYQLSKVPELPYAKCTCKNGCRCMIMGDEFL